MKNIYIFTILCMVGIFHAQVKISNISNTVDNSLILEVESSTKGGGVILPRTNLGASLFDTENPVLNPVNGMIIFNMGDPAVTPFKEGFYIWRNDKWDYIADNNNSVTDLTAFANGLSTTKLSSSLGVFEDLDNLNVPLFSNSINEATYDSGTGVASLPPGTYSTELVITFNAPGLNAGIENGIGNMVFESQLKNPQNNEVIATSLDYVPVRNTSSDGKMTFIFDFKSDTAIDVIPSIANGPGATYTGPIEITSYSIHFQISK